MRTFQFKWLKINPIFVTFLTDFVLLKEYIKSLKVQVELPRNFVEMCDTKSYSSHKNLSFQTFLDCYQILTELRLFLGRFNLSQADRPRYTLRTVRTCITVHLADCPRSMGGLSALQFFCWSEPLVKNFMNGGPSASYPRTVRSTKFQIAQNFANFHNFNFELGSLLK